MTNKLTTFIGFNSTLELKQAIEKYARIEGVKPSVIIRKSIVKYLKQKNIIKTEEDFL